MPTAPTPVDLTFDEWGRITRFLESARLAFARERNLWAALELDAPADVRISTPAHQGRYKVKLEQHLAAIGDEETLYASVLLHSYALAESAAGDKLGREVRTLGGIEDWGNRLLAGNGTAWIDVKAGKAGAVELAVVRNAFAHGSRSIDANAEQRLRAVGITSRHAGSVVSLTYSDVREFRVRLLSLLRFGGIRR
jgi:hypothetical protein